MGILILGALCLYLMIAVTVVKLVVGYAQKNGKNVQRWGWSAALVMYLIPFWDWLPTVAVHQYYCAKESGFWIYKTVDQWKKENPGGMDTLVASDPSPSTSRGNAENYNDTYYWNERFNSLNRKNGPFLFNTWRFEEEIVDVKTGQVVGRRVDFSTGNGHVGGEPELRFWMHSDHCIGGRDRAIDFVRTMKQFRGAVK